MGNNIVIWKLSPAERAELEPAPLPHGAHTLDEITRKLPGGGYTTFRTFGGKRVMRLHSHYDRLEETARLTGRPLMLDRERISQALHQALANCPEGENRVRMILDQEQVPGTIYILIEPLRVPDQTAYEKGVRAVTRQMQRENPKAKLTAFIHKASTVRQDLPEGINEALMVGEDGRVLEGLSSNFFAVKDGVIWTADQGVLSGITRSLVLDVIREQSMPLRLEGIAAGDLPDIDEAFITSASRAVLPVVEIDGRVIGNGRPGPVTLKLLQGYLERVQGELEPV